MVVTSSFRPTPNRDLHIGSIWNAVANWLWARQTGGEFVLVMDDLWAEYATCWTTGYDPHWLLPRYLEDLTWFGLTPDRVEWSLANRERHVWANSKLGYREPQTIGAIPFGAPERVNRRSADYFHDRVWEAAPATALTPYYLTCCVVDDHDFGITGWIAGMDLMPAWNLCLDLYARLGFSPPDIDWHHTFRVAEESVKISKTNERERTVRNYREAGYDPDRILETLLECNRRSRMARLADNVIPAGTLELDPIGTLKWENGIGQDIIADAQPDTDLPSPWRKAVREEWMSRYDGLTRVTIAEQYRASLVP